MSYHIMATFKSCALSAHSIIIDTFVVTFTYTLTKKSGTTGGGGMHRRQDEKEQTKKVPRIEKFFLQM